MANDTLRGRQVALALTNRSGVDIVAGDVVVIDLVSGDSIVTTSTASLTDSVVCVAVDDIKSLEIGRVVAYGLAVSVNISGSPSVGDYLYTSATPTECIASSTYGGGAFGFVTNDETPYRAFVWGVPAVIGATEDHDHDTEYSALGHSHTESDITDLDHNAIKIQGRDVAVDAPTDGQVYSWNDADSEWKPFTIERDAIQIQGRDVSSAVPTDGQVYAWDDYESEWVPTDVSGVGGSTETIFTFTVSGVLSVASSPIRLLAPRACTVDNVVVTVGTQPTGSNLIIDVNKNGTTLFTTQANRPTIASGSSDDLSSVPDVTSIAQNDVITVDIDQIGSSVAGSNLVVQVRCS